MKMSNCAFKSVLYYTVSLSATITKGLPYEIVASSKLFYTSMKWTKSSVNLLIVDENKTNKKNELTRMIFDTAFLMIV